MLVTRNIYPHTDLEVTTDDDGSVTIQASDRVVREHMHGRSKGTREHTVLRLHFDDRASAIHWLSDAVDRIESP